MKIIVFGATGGVGKWVLEQGLKAGHEITAFVRTPQKVTITHENLAVVQGDAFDKEAVSAAIAGHEAVISCLGSSKGMKKTTELREMVKNIAEGMTENHVSRIIYTASAGVHKELTGVAGKAMMLLLKNPLVDHRAAIAHITAHNLTYTIAPPMGLTDKEFTGTYRESKKAVPEKSSTISRADVAHFILKALQNPSYENTSVGLAD